MKVNINSGSPLNVNIGGSNPLDLKIGDGTKNTDYPPLTRKPSIEQHVLVGDSTIQDIGVGTLTVQEIERILYLG